MEEASVETKVGVYVCHCGTNIAGVVDSAQVARFAATLPEVVVARDHKYTCSDPGQEMIQKDIRELGVNRVVVAACSPRLHEATFRRTLMGAGLNPYFLEIANIREQASWVHQGAPDQATEKAKDLVAAAVMRVVHHTALYPQKSAVEPAVLVIGGGVAGIQAALDVADAGYQVYLVERQPAIGGKMAQLDETFPTLDCST